MQPSDQIILNTPQNAINVNEYNNFDEKSRAIWRARFGFTQAQIDEYNKRHELPPLSIMNLSETMDSTYNWTRDTNASSQRNSNT